MHDDTRRLTSLSTPASGRRGFVTSTALAALAALAIQRPAMAQEADTATATPEAEAAAATITDADILNFALQLEYLEAEFYLRAIGSSLSSNEVSGQGTLGKVTGGHKVPFKTKAIRLYAEEIANDERAHVNFLRKALGSGAAARPTIDFNTSFTNAARAAGLIGRQQTIDVFSDENLFLLAALIFEDVGVTAYKGAAPLIEDKGTLEAAAGILAVEAYHAANVRTVLFARGLFAEAQKISDVRDRLDGPGDKDQGIGTANRANIVPADENGIAFSRSPQEVLNIVYLGGGATNFGFFPKRLNGTIK